MRNKLLLLILLIPSLYLHAATRTINLTVAYKTVNFAGRKVQAIAVNNQIPAPTLHFTEGDDVTINVYNHLDQGTAIHWHGLIVPWKMDGVAGVTQKPIPPNGVFHYHFTLKQSGTYWYHAHKGLQEQRGVYGALIIDPRKSKTHYNKDIPIVLSDWSNTDPDQIYNNVKKEGDFYSVNMPIQASLWRFFHDYHNAKTPKQRSNLWNAYKMMQQMRMSIYDISDVAYDAFLLNGHTKKSPWAAKVNVGDKVRLRIVNAGANSYFHLKIPGTLLHVIHVQGNDVKPYDTPELTLAPAETYDIVVTIDKAKPYVIYAESADKRGYVYGVLRTSVKQAINNLKITPFPDPKPTMMMHNEGMKMDHGHHGMGHQMPSVLSSPSKYDKLQATHKTNNPKQAVESIHMTLAGYMDRYMWFLNGVSEADAKPIMIKKGHWYRLIFVNTTMMHHPMHLHGHWFILRNGHGAYDPKIHTIDVAPGATMVADFHADMSGQWYFHCHNMYHMKAGMATIFRYATDVSVKNLHEPQQVYLPGHKQVDWHTATLLDINGDFFHHVYEGSLISNIGYDYNKLQIAAEDMEMRQSKLENADVDIFYWRLLNQFWAVKGGMNVVFQPAEKTYVQPGLGLEGTMPYFLETNVRMYLHKGSVKFALELERDTQITNHFFLRLASEILVATKTVASDEIGSGVNQLQWTVRPFYQFNGNFSLYAQYQHTDYYAARKRLLRDEGEAISENTISFGVSLFF